MAFGITSQEQRQGNLSVLRNLQDAVQQRQNRGATAGQNALSRVQRADEFAKNKQLESARLGESIRQFNVSKQMQKEEQQASRTFQREQAAQKRQQAKQAAQLERELKQSVEARKKEQRQLENDIKERTIKLKEDEDIRKKEEKKLLRDAIQELDQRRGNLGGIPRSGANPVTVKRQRGEAEALSSLIGGAGGKGFTKVKPIKQPEQFTTGTIKAPKAPKEQKPLFTYNQAREVFDKFSGKAFSDLDRKEAAKSILFHLSKQGHSEESILNYIDELANGGR